VRICSLLPAATAMLYALGLEESLVGVTHECRYPPEAASKPVVLRPVFDPGRLGSGEIDRQVRESLARGEPLYRADLELLAALGPELLIGQDLCEVCALPPAGVAEVRALLAGRPSILALHAHSVVGMLQDMRRVAAAAGVPERGESLVAALQARIAAVRQAVRGRPRRRVACLEWIEPLYSPGHWMPELVEAAGGTDLLGLPGGRSVRLAWEQVAAAEPEVLILMPCGFGPERGAAEAGMLRRMPGWEGLPAVRNGQVWAVRGDKYFSGASPYLVDGLELLARILHPGLLVGVPSRDDAIRIGESRDGG
jgi:iron complex transport system substrate-binding protein